MLVMEMTRSEIPVRSLSRQPGAGINPVQVEYARRPVPSAAFRNADVTSPASARPASARSSASTS